MRVAFDQPWEDRHARCVQDGNVVPKVGKNLFRWAYGNDHPVADRNGSVGDQVKLTLRCASTRGTGVGHTRELRGVDHVEAAHG